MSVTRFRSEKYKDTWDVWEKKRFLASPFGAPCTGELKLKPLKPVEEIPGAVHIFGYTAEETHRMKRLERLKPDLRIECPLIDAGMKSADARGYLLHLGIQPPITYELGMPHANCIPCPKSTSPGYWALMREHFLAKFKRIAALSRKLGVRLVRFKGKRIFLDELPIEVVPSGADAPGCDLLCEIAKQGNG